MSFRVYYLNVSVQIPLAYNFFISLHPHLLSNKSAYRYHSKLSSTEVLSSRCTSLWLLRQRERAFPKCRFATVSALPQLPNRSHSVPFHPYKPVSVSYDHSPKGGNSHA
jgi:hypothetical protein